MTEQTITIVVRRAVDRPNYWIWESVGYPHSAPSKTPFLDAARALQRDGLPNTTIIEMVHADRPDVVALRAAVGVAASLTVEEGDHVPRFRRWRPNQRFHTSDVTRENLTESENGYPL